MISKLRFNTKDGIVMSDDKKVVDISHIKNNNDKEKFTEILVQAVTLGKLVGDAPNMPTDIKLYYCDQINMLIDYVKKEVERIGK